MRTCSASGGIPRDATRRACLDRGHAVAAALAVLLAAATGCVHTSSRSGCSLPGSAPWREYRSAHFVIDLEGSGRDPASVVALFEDLHAAVVASLIAEPVEIPGRVRVVVLPSASALARTIGGRDVIGLFWVSALGEPTILLSADALDELPQTIAHELAHHVSYHLFPRQPRWFAEGLAQFVESVARADAQGRRWAGGEPTSGWAVDAVKLTRAGALLQGGGGFLDDPYLTSWVLYRFLWNERPAQFSDFQRRLSAGDAPRDAWRAAFPEWDPAAGKPHLLDALLERHVRRERGLRWEVARGEVDRSFTASAASPADLHLVLLDARLFGTNRLLVPSLRRETAEEALREDPLHPVAIAELAEVEGTPALAALRASVASRPDDGRGWYLLARATEDPGEREDALRRAVARWPEGALPHAALASELARTGRAREAVREVNRALELAPWNPDVVGILATVALELGKCRESLLLQERAADVAAAHGVGTGRSDPEALLRRLAEIRKRCEAAGERAPAAPAS